MFSFLTGSSDSEFLLTESSAYYYADKFEEMLTLSEAIILLDPENSDVWFNNGIALGNLGMYEEAIESYDEAIKINSDFDDAWYNNGIASYHLERYDESITAYETALEINPDNQLAKDNLELAKKKQAES